MLNSPNQLQYNMLNGASSMSSLDLSKQFGKQVLPLGLKKARLINRLINITFSPSEIQNLTIGTFKVFAHPHIPVIINVNDCFEIDNTFQNGKDFCYIYLVSGSGQKEGHSCSCKRGSTGCGAGRR